MEQPRFNRIVVYFLILLWAYAATSKLLNRTATGASLEVIFSQPYATLISWTVPVTELLAAALLAVPRLRAAGLWLSFGLMLIFTGYIALVLSGGFEKHPCTCGGLLQSLSWKQHLVFNLTVLALHLLPVRELAHARRTGPTGKEVDVI